jgi:hypothetical protein
MGDPNGRQKAAELYPEGGKLYQPERNNKVRKHVLFALASVVIAVLGCQSAPAQLPGGLKIPKVSKPKPTLTPTESPQPAPSSELPLLRVCRGCVPFNVGGGLLDSLLAPDGEGELLPAGSTEDVREKVMSRLGSALDACRKRRKETAR